MKQDERGGGVLVEERRGEMGEGRDKESQNERRERRMRELEREREGEVDGVVWSGVDERRGGVEERRGEVGE